ncbi:imidazoleglycerol-phosphate dehydratase HisB [Seleniivibrio woodruffii]|uniref:Imidazoleglycerol-phosphate dehydratase n=1 Tax=Seleniivibrio woodruffii TaxID=1078050 RepID=A0A4R1KC30_9BACT|nr:imidazoleglycerol-phosphate dehydratase HisB [Seleniivibrio woodruffii]TCK61687.1 imidazoleglycerol-phosphate dehydratase [Seleniivibrio woodruffii]TVZ35198.1 imidazoleglycerol-phosphate dehydratase [Seleniivibrio woodruffii]
MAERKSSISRKTTETEIALTLNVDGGGKYSVDTGIGFLNHMLELFTRHGGFDIELKARGDLHIDGHHTAEDIGIVLGDAFREALGDKRGIRRYGFFLLPMDETLIECAVDFSGRTYLNFDADIPAEKVGDFDTELTEEFFKAFADRAGINLHIIKRYGRNTHHIIEGIFKCVARAIKDAVRIESDQVMSTKGTL